MKKYNFDKVVNRFETNSYKWNVLKNELPMWVADMNFETSPEISEAIKKRLERGALGYNIVPNSFFESYISWWKRRHNYIMKKEWLMFCTGVVPAISSIVRKMTNIGDKVIVLSPVYNIFYNSIVNNGREVVQCELLYENGKYDIDYNDFEKKLSDSKTSLLIFCNPHNPIGKVWSEEEIKNIGELCIKHNVLILSDEIHCDLTHIDQKYVPFASVLKEIEQNTITCISPTKAFNIAGIQTSAISIPNERIRKLVNRAINTDEIAEPNSFAIQVTEAAFNYGEEWLNQLNKYLYENRSFLENEIKKYFPEIAIIPAQATYLMWLDLSKVCEDTNELCDYIRKETGLYLSDGSIFGGNGKKFIRWNYACPKSILEDGFKRFEKAISKYKKNNGGK